MANDGRYGTGFGTAGAADLTDGVLGRRLLAYAIDAVVIFALALVPGFLIGIAGFVTFGAAWLLYAILLPTIAIVYNAMMLPSRAAGTIGMRLAGVAVLDATTGARVNGLAAGLHAFLFYVGIGTLLLLALDIAIGLARDDRRLGHDLLTNFVFVRR